MASVFGSGVQERAQERAGVAGRCRLLRLTDEARVKRLLLCERGGLVPDKDGVLTDEQLLERCQRGDQRALERLVERHQRRLCSLCLRITGCWELAEEAAVEAFARVWLRRRQWRGTGSARVWIDRIAVRVALDLQRRQRRWWRRLRAAAADTGRSSGTGTDSDDPAVQAERSDSQQHLARQLDRAIGSLAPQDRALVHLYYYQECTLAEAAETLGASRDALKMRLVRIRQRLGCLLESCHEFTRQ